MVFVATRNGLGCRFFRAKFRMWKLHLTGALTMKAPIAMQNLTPRPIAPALETLSGGDARQITWRLANRYDLALIIQSAPSFARGPVARLVAAGVRNTHEGKECR